MSRSQAGELMPLLMVILPARLPLETLITMPPRPPLLLLDPLLLPPSAQFLLLPPPLPARLPLEALLPPHLLLARPHSPQGNHRGLPQWQPLLQNRMPLSVATLNCMP